MSNPASKNTINRLSDIMGNNIKECFPVLLDTVGLLSKIKSLIKETKNEDEIKIVNNQKDVLELRSSVLYAILEIAVALRADFRSDIAIEKRVNLKYLVFITSEFYKSTFMPEERANLWKKVSEYISSMNVDVINEINKINDGIKVYKDTYFNKDKDKRDIALHYDFNLDVLYNYIIEIGEEEEAQRVCAFLAVILKINELITSNMYLLHIKESFQNTFKNYESIEVKYEFETLKKRLYPMVGEKIQKFANLIDKNMKSYNITNNLSDDILSVLGVDGIDNIKEKRDYAKLGIISHYLYLDLGTALRCYLSSEYFIEKQLNLTRINLIIYEGYKKIYIPINKDSKSLWDQYVYSVLFSDGKGSLKTKIKSVELKLHDYKKDNTLVDANERHKYVHLRNHKKFTLPEFLDILLNLNPHNELNKSLLFMQLLSEIIKLNIESIDIKSEIESVTIRQQIMKPFNQIKSKISNSNMKKEDKQRMEEGIDKIMNLFN